ncbi:MAG: hypothetical protein EHM33_11140 [Chloroflexi bacterium]|nr:MAG: hypothetical protein EHM33_11140 [Chloroflexota bacterium]
MALKILGLSFRDTWQEFGTILIVHLLFLLGTVLIIPGPPATLALFFYGNKIARGETANERDFLHAIRAYWGPAWRWGFINLAVIGLLIGDYYLTGKLASNSNTVHFIQGLYIALLAGWLLLQIFTLPFLFEQEQPAVLQALRNAAVFIRSNLLFVLVLALLLGLSLAAGMLTFMLTFAFGGALVAFAGNRAVLKDLPDR